jgi:hypothetical protein
MREREERGETYTNDSPSLDRIVLGLDFLQRSWDLRSSLGGCTGRLEEVTKSLSLLFVVGWVPLF